MSVDNDPIFSLSPNSENRGEECYTSGINFTFTLFSVLCVCSLLSINILLATFSDEMCQRAEQSEKLIRDTRSR